MQTMHQAADSVATNTTYTQKQDIAVLKQKITDFLTVQTVGYPGKVTVKAGGIDPNSSSWRPVLTLMYSCRMAVVHGVKTSVGVAVQRQHGPYTCKLL